MYRRRRIVALLGVLLVASVVTWLLVTQPWQGLAAGASPVPTSSATPTPTLPDLTDAIETPEPTESTPPDGAEPSREPTPDALGTARPCEAHQITVEPLTDQDSYRSGQNPQLSIRLTNDGAQDCTLNVGTTSQKFTISSGSDVWWRSTDCQTEPSDMVVTLAAGQTVTSAAPITWDRTRSNVSTCGDADRPRAPGGGASYHLSVEIAGVASLSSKQFLLY